MSKATPLVLQTSEWNTSAVRYMQPKVNDKGGKSINIISTQTNRAIHISTPLLLTWGISDYVDEKTGVSDGKFQISLAFPMQGTAATDELLNKLKAFENQILDAAVKYSDAWFGEEMSREVAKHTFFPILKYSKDKQTKKIDYNKPPTLRAKVPNYEGRWGIEIYDTKGGLVFPCDNPNMTPMDFVPKMSNVACVLQCGGIWTGGKGWGVTWKLNQCVVKPQENLSVFGKCHIQLSSAEVEAIDKEVVAAAVPVPEDELVVSTLVEDSDTEEAAPAPASTPEQPIAKKVVAAPETPVAVVEAPAEVKTPEAPVIVTAPSAPVKKILKKKAT